MNVLCISDYYRPGYLGGGPITTLVNMRKQLKNLITLSIFTRDRDLGDFNPYLGIETNQWLETPDGPIYYASPQNFTVRGIRQVIKSSHFDIIYLNSFFSTRASILPLLYIFLSNKKIPILLAPRGEFSPGAMAIKKHKKKVFTTIARCFGLYKNIFWHASTTIEADHIKRIFPKMAKRIFIAADPIATETLVLETSKIKKESGRLRVAFISRISPKKNIDGLIKIISKISLPIQLNIFGPIEDETYWKSCIRLIKDLPENIQVIVHGPIPPESVASTFSQYELFAFPTHGENFGHVIFEALKAGTPVLVSDQTPWQQDDAGALSVIPLADTSSWCQAIENIANLTAADFELMRQAAQRYAMIYACESEKQKENLEPFSKVLSF